MKKLSELIREGAAKRPQCTTGDYFSGGKSCAIGAALEAHFGTRDENIMIRRISYDKNRPSGIEFPDEYLGYVTETPWNIVQKVEHMNDYDLDTREQIADWLEAQGY